MSQEECARLREGVPYVKVYRYNPKHLCPNLNGYGDNDFKISDFNKEHTEDDLNDDRNMLERF